MTEEQEANSSGAAQEKSSAACVWVLASGPTQDIEGYLTRLTPADKVVAANGGTALAARLGLVPDLVMGDLDSATPSSLADLEARGVEVRRYDHNTKWETDTELAVLAALAWRPRRIILLGATGGRLDHSLANVLLLTHPRLQAVDLRLVEGGQEIFLAKPGAWNRLHADVGDTVSLLPVGEDVEGVRTEGLDFPLVGETLLKGRGRGVSNRVAAAGAQVWLDRGQLLVVVSHVADIPDAST